MVCLCRLAMIGVVVPVVLSAFGCATRDQYLRLREDLYQVRKVLADTRSDLETQRREIDALRGEMEASRRRRAMVPEAPPELGIVGQLPPEGPVAPGAGQPGSTGAVGAPPGKELTKLGGDQPGEDEYRTALALVEQRNCGEAIPRLRSYLRKYPDTRLSDNAQYWIGECYYVQRDFNNAILAFYDVTRRYPKGDRVCAAMLKQGLAFVELGDEADARIVLERLVQTHPDCKEAGQARTKLSSLQ